MQMIRAETLGFGLKPASFISNTGCLKSHDWKQFATQGILKFCLKDAQSLAEKQRETLFVLFDCLSDLCAESQSLDELDDLENRVNQALARL